jgi:hypothetical protein
MILDLTLRYPNSLGDIINVGFDWITRAMNLYMGFIVTYRTITTFMCFIIIGLIIGMAFVMAAKSEDQF